MSGIFSHISTDRKATIVVLSLLMRSAIFVALLLFISLSTDSMRLPQSSGAPVNSKPEPGTSPELPSGMVRSDWDGILRAHRDWKHEVKANGSGWKAHNPATGLTASFDRRGVEVRPEGDAWTWGLDLVSYGVGGAQVSVGKRTPAVETAAREVTYGWDDNLKEWYRNHDRGFEHGYTIQRRPEAAGVDGPLELNLKVEGDLQVTGLEAGRSVVFGKKAGEALLRYSDLKVVDASGKELEARFEGDGQDAFRIVIEEREAAYPLTIDPTIAQQAYLKASNTGAGDGFGASVAIYGDTLVVGAPWEDSNATGVNRDQTNNSATDSGAAYVFVRSGGIWSQQAYIKASNTAIYSNFGDSVAIFGDTLVVGAPSESNSALGVNGNQNETIRRQSGAVYVLERSGGIWKHIAYLKAVNAGEDDKFGSSVGISGNTVVVGAPGEASSAVGVNDYPNSVNNLIPNSGAVYVFVGSGTYWSQQAYLKASNTGVDDYFGYSVAISGDTVVVGATGEKSNATGINGDQTNNSAAFSGAVYIFVRIGGSWSQQAYLKASNTEEYDWFGSSVAISGETVVVGAYYEDSNATGVNGDQTNNLADASGAVYIFVRSGTSWSHQAYLKASNTDDSDYFGISVAISNNTVVVGAHAEASSSTGVNGGQIDNLAYQSGAAYAFVRTGTNWIQSSYFKASNTELRDLFGNSVAISGDTVIVGAHPEDSNATGVNGDQTSNNSNDSGAAYVFIPISNNVPTILSTTRILRSAGSGLLNTTIATITDTDDPIVLLTVKVNGGTLATSNGVTVSSIVNINGTVTASINVPCEATIGTTLFTLQVSDGVDTVSTTLDVQVTANSLPSISYSSITINPNSSSTINPVITPADNGSVSSISINSSGTFTGSVTVNNSTGVVSISNAAPVGTHTITIRASDNCGATTDAVIALTVNAIPTVTAGSGISVIGGATSWKATIATVADADSTAGNLSMTVTSANPTAGVTISNILNSNGTITADILASCQVITGPAGFTLQVSDGMALATTALNISVTANSPPTLSYSSQTLASGWSGTIIPAAGPSDNGSVTVIAVQSQGTYTGAVSVNSSTGLVTLSGAAPVGTHTITIRATDNCGATTDATISIIVNGLPTITTVSGISRTIGSGLANSTIATVNDEETTAASLTVTINGGTSASSGGITITNLVNTAGTITADMTAVCGGTAGIAAFTLQVNDGTATTTTTFNVAVVANALPMLTYAVTSVSGGDSTTISPATGPSDNGSVAAIAVHSQGSYTGAVTVNSSTGLVTLSGAAPAATHTITIRATDNCGATTDATIQLTVTASGGSGPIAGGNPSIGLPGSGGSISPGSPVTITQTLTNTSSSPATTVYVATLPGGFSALSCTSPTGSCVIGTGTQVSPAADPDGLRLKSNPAATSASQTVTWSGTIPGNGSVTISYQVQVGVQAISGTQYCVTSTIGGATGPSSCLTVNAPSAGPGSPPIFAGLPNTQKPASVLIFNLYTSSVSSSREETQISLTNTNPVGSTSVHLFFIDGTTCTTADQVVTLTQNQTASFLASDIDPGVTGYLIAVAVEANGCPTISNHLIGGALVRFESGHRALLPAVGVAGLSAGSLSCQANPTTVTLDFNGTAYDELPRSLAIHMLPSPANGNSSMLIINRIGGDLTTGAARLGPLAGLLFDDSEVARSFTLAAGGCQMRGLLGNNFPRTVPRYTTVIPAGRTGWMKLWAAGDEAISGVMINEAVSGLSGGYNLQALTTTSSATLTIQVIPN